MAIVFVVWFLVVVVVVDVHRDLDVDLPPHELSPGQLNSNSYDVQIVPISLYDQTVPRQHRPHEQV